MLTSLLVSICIQVSNKICKFPFPSLPRQAMSKMTNRRPKSLLTTIMLLVSFVCLSQQAPLETTTNGGPHCWPFIFTRGPPFNTLGRVDITANLMRPEDINRRAFVEAGRPAMNMNMRTTVPRTPYGRSRSRIVQIEIENQYSHGYTIALERFFMSDDIRTAEPNSVQEFTVPAAENSPFGFDIWGRKFACFELEDASVFKWAIQVRGPITPPR